MGAAGASLAARELRRSYSRGGFTIDVPNLGVAAGEVLALLGPSGSGKSTLLALLGLLERPDAGQVLLDGRDVSTRDRDARLQMAAVFQRPYLFKGSVAANVAYGLAARGVPRTGRLHRVAAALERVGLGGFENRSALALSGGEAQRVSLARALVVEPRVLLLDEPLASLDPLLKERLTHDFASIMRDAGVTVIYVTHDQNEALVVADNVAVMHSGKIVTKGHVDEVMGLPADDWTASFLGMEPALHGRVVRQEDGLAIVGVGVDMKAVEIAVVGDFEAGTEVDLAIRPEDVLLVEGEAHEFRSSARNRLAGVVIQVAPRGATYRVALDAAGVRFASSVSRSAVVELGIEPGKPVTAVFKATAVRVRLAAPPHTEAAIG